MNGEAVIIGCGAAGLSAALFLARHNCKSVLVADMPPERSQSGLALGGINAALGEDDSAEKHARDTCSAGCFLADAAAIRGMTDAAPKIVDELECLGAVFRKNYDRTYALRMMGGHSCGRTVHANGGIGRQVMDALSQEFRRHADAGRIQCRFGWRFHRLGWRNAKVCGAWICHMESGESAFIPGPVLMASGGLNGLFGLTTGSVANTGEAAASLFADGVPFSNLEFIQFHPTTLRLRNKCLLISESARSDGGRLFVRKGDKEFYFMEDKYPDHGNLMPRDTVSREEWHWLSSGHQVFLDLRHLPDASRKQLFDTCGTYLHLTGMDPAVQPVPVEPGIHYFMGGIQVDALHHTPVEGLYAAGECACQYHGANRLGGNSLLGAIYGGMTAAREILGHSFPPLRTLVSAPRSDTLPGGLPFQPIMRKAMGVVRDERGLAAALEALDKHKHQGTVIPLCRAMLFSAMARRESRGSHCRSDFPECGEEFRKNSIAVFSNGDIRISWKDVV